MIRFHRWQPLTLVLLAGLILTPVRAQDSTVLPKDTHVVIRLNVRGILDSDLAKKLGIDQAKDLIQLAPGAEILKEIGFNPFSDLDSLTIAAPGGEKNEQGLIIVKGKFNAKKLVEKGEKEAKNNAESLKVIKIGKNTAFEISIPNQQVPLFVTIPSDSTILVSPNKDYLEANLGSKETGPDSKELSNLIDKLDKNLALAIALDSKALELKNLPEQARAILDGISSIAGGIALTKDINLEVIVGTKDKDSAKAITDQLGQGLNQALGFLGLMAANQKELVPALEFVKSLKVSNKEKAVSISGKLPGSILEDAIKGKESK